LEGLVHAGGRLTGLYPPSGFAFAYVRNRAGPPNVADPLVYKVVNVLADIVGAKNVSD
jgi:hypothetical protein